MKYLSQLMQLLIIIMFISTASFSQAELVKDINPGSDGTWYGWIKEFNDQLMIYADDGEHGYELWMSDGSESGTFLLKDIYPEETDFELISILSIQDDIVYFSADDKVHGNELWVTDGTKDGTKMVKDIVAGDGGSIYGDAATFYKGNLYFHTEIDNVYELWKSDGTASGTMKVKEICSFCNNEGILKMVNYKDVFYFITSFKYFVSDGTEKGTEVIFDDTNHKDFGFLDKLIVENGLMYIVGGGFDTIGDEPWVSDGTTNGTQLLGDLNPTGSSNPVNFVTFKEDVYFIANKYIYKTKGLNDTPVIFYPLTNGPRGISEDTYLNVHLDKLFFNYTDWLDFKIHLSCTDGDTNNITRLAWVSESNSSDIKTNFTELNGKLYFRAADTTRGRFFNSVHKEIYSTDGTIVHTQQIANVNDRNSGSSPYALTILNNFLYFFANDGIHGRELWKLKVDSTTSNFNLNNITLNQFHLSPNPVTNYFKLEIRNDASLNGTKASLDIHDLKGEKVHEIDVLINNEQIEVNNLELPNGMYVLNLRTIRGMEVHKFVVSK